MAARDKTDDKPDDRKPNPGDVGVDLMMRELEEEVRREQIAKLWKNYGTYVILGAAAIVAGVGGWQWSKQRAIARAAEAGAQFESAVQLAEGGSTPNAIAGDHAKAGRPAEAVAAFDALGKDADVDVLLRDFARLQAAALRLGQADWTEMQNRLNDLAGLTGPYRASAKELLGLAALKAGRTADARQTFQELLADQKTPQALSQRAQIIMGQLATAELATSPPASGGTSDPAPKKP
jgi:hypothetical protein